ncbi:transcription factor E2F6 isoform X2 [Gadus macrocephalus]|uniref:transcription factor E2F6 isoform X2 n=1 Tax=Gadus macrocephalus TaxID=80720 RepID=UPI0028CB9D80|nr:transcription factor E2F6 isoform X2 [Gadus macrocephalus]
MNKCVVSGCPNRRKGPLNRVQKRFYQFPKDQARVKVWLAALRETEKQDSTEQHVLCEDHFLPQHITAGGIREDAIPIMSPYLDGVLGTDTPWAEESSEEDAQWAEDGVEEDAPLPSKAPLESASNRWRPGDEKLARLDSYSRNVCPDVSLAWLTKALLQEMGNAPDGVLDLRQAVLNLKTRRRRVYDITQVLSSISLIKKESANKVKWIGKTPVSCFLKKSQLSSQKELSNLKSVEDSLDEVIKTCAKQLFDLTDNPDNIKSAYVTYEDVSRIEVFQDQTVLVVKAPEDTKLQVPTPKEDSIQMNLKAVKGPISVVTSEMGLRPGTSTTTGECFVTVEQSHIRTLPLNTESTNPQSAVKSS